MEFPTFCSEVTIPISKSISILVEEIGTAQTLEVDLGEHGHTIGGRASHPKLGTKGLDCQSILVDGVDLMGPTFLIYRSTNVSDMLPG